MEMGSVFFFVLQIYFLNVQKFSGSELIGGVELVLVLIFLMVSPVL